MEMPDGAIGHQQTMLKIPILRVLRCTLDEFLHENEVVGMDSLKHQLEGGLGRAVISEYPETFLGPDQLSGGNIPAETARAAQSLGFRQIPLAPTQRLLGALTVLDVRCCPIPPNDPSGFIPQRYSAQQEPAMFAIGPS